MFTRAIICSCSCSAALTIVFSRSTRRDDDGFSRASRADDTRRRVAFALGSLGETRQSQCDCNDRDSFGLRDQEDPTFVNEPEAWACNVQLRVQKPEQIVSYHPDQRNQPLGPCSDHSRKHYEKSGSIWPLAHRAPTCADICAIHTSGTRSQRQIITVIMFLRWHVTAG